MGTTIQNQSTELPSEVKI